MRNDLAVDKTLSTSIDIFSRGVSFGANSQKNIRTSAQLKLEFKTLRRLRSGQRRVSWVVCLIVTTCL